MNNYRVIFIIAAILAIGAGLGFALHKIFGVSSHWGWFAGGGAVVFGAGLAFVISKLNIG